MAGLSDTSSLRAERLVAASAATQWSRRLRVWRLLLGEGDRATPFALDECVRGKAIAQVPAPRVIGASPKILCQPPGVR
jgi:hypothetical protein